MSQTKPTKAIQKLILTIAISAAIAAAISILCLPARAYDANNSYSSHSSQSSPEHIRSELNQLAQVKSELASNGIGTGRILDMLTEAQAQYDSGDFTGASQTISQIYRVKELAERLPEEIGTAKEHYTWLEKNKPGGYLEGILNNISLAEKEFQNQNFEAAENGILLANESIAAFVAREYTSSVDDIQSLSQVAANSGFRALFAISLADQAREALDAGDAAGVEDALAKARTLLDAISAYSEAKNATEGLSAEGIQTGRVNDLLLLAKGYLESGEVSAADGYAQQAKKAASQASSLSARIRDANGKLQTAGSSPAAAAACDAACLSETGQRLASAREELVYGNYEKSESELQLAEATIDDIETAVAVEELKSQNPDQNITSFASTHKPALLVMLAAIIAAGLASWQKLAQKVNAQRLEAAKRELSSNEKILKERQKSYYIHKNISRETYSQAYEELNERIFLAREKIAGLGKKMQAAAAKAKRK